LVRIHPVSITVGLSALFCAGIAVSVAAPVRGARRPVKGAAKPTAQPTFAHDIAPLVQKYCATCHSGPQATAGITLSGYKDEASVIQARSLWENVQRNVQSGHMPPKNALQPTPAERTRLAGWIGSKLSKVDCDLRDPGRVTLRRLNRAEYNNTIRDLVGVDFHPADDFPSDDVGYGFDNIGDVLSISPILMEKYLAAAEKIAEAAIVTPEPKGPVQRLEAEKLESSAPGGVVDNTFRSLNSNGEVFTQFTFPAEGDYLVRVRAFGQQAGTEPARMSLRLDSKDLTTFDVAATVAEPKVYEYRVHVPAGKQRLAAAFINDFYAPDDPNPDHRDRNLVMDYIEVLGPVETRQGLPESHRRIFIVEPKSPTQRGAAARKILAAFAARAYRRPPMAEEVERVARISDMAVQQGESFERAIQLGVEAVLVSPNFLFRVELDADPHNDKLVHPIGDYELASRLSYFLWSSMPDEELFKLAASHRLHEPAMLESQVQRMLKDPKAHALVENFADQWLQIRNLKTVSPDPGRFPGFDDALRAAMQKETELFFESVMHEDRSVLEFLNGKTTFLNERLARHYGIDGVKGDEFRKVTLAGDQRAGIITQASVLTITSNPSRTSPVKRGKWVMEQILGTPLPPPPPNVPVLNDDKNGPLVGTLRQRMEQHRKDPGCASCHSRMDPIGFGLENFDAVGKWRAEDGKAPVDASGTLPDGQSFRGPAQLRAILMKQKGAFVHTLCEQLLTYSLGRGLEHYDRCAVDAIARTVASKGYRFSAMVTEIAKSDPFRKRRGEGKID
jgi:hypothetical protein